MAVTSAKEDQYLDLGFFSWPLSNAGYYIDRDAIPDLLSGMAGKVDGPFILEKPETIGYLRTKPLNDNPSLFLEFADLDGSEKSIVDFTNQHGLLTQGIMLENIPHEIKDKNGCILTTRVIRGNDLCSWRHEHFFLKHTIQVWKWLSENAAEKLGLVIRWTNSNKIIDYFIGPEHDLRIFHRDGGAYPQKDYSLKAISTGETLDIIRGELASDRSQPVLMSRLVPGDVTIPAQAVIQKMINKKLSEYPVKPMLLMDEHNKLQQYFVPENLLSAMWFQFFQAATGAKKFKRCVVCHQWEDVTNKRSTWTKHPECAGRERTAKYRQRKETEK